MSLHGSETILVVEDDEGVRRLATRSLEHLGYEVVVAGSVSEAHGKLMERGAGVDCLVVDVQLPDGEGRSAATRIVEGRRGVPILYVSGSQEALAAIRADAAGGCAFLAKPFTPIDLARELRSLLERGPFVHRPGGRGPAG